MMALWSILISFRIYGRVRNGTTIFQLGKKPRTMRVEENRALARSIKIPLLLDDMILTETLFPHLWEIDETAHRRVEQRMTELLEKNPTPDKETQQFAWVQHMSSLKAQAVEIVNAELIFC